MNNYSIINALAKWEKMDRRSEGQDKKNKIENIIHGDHNYRRPQGAKVTRRQPEGQD